MVLNIGGGIFQQNIPDVSDAGYMSIASGDNLITAATVTGDIEDGGIPSMYTTDLTTFISTSDGGDGSYTRYITVDLLKKQNDAVATAFYSAHSSSAASTSVTVSIETSTNGTDWTEETSTSVAGVGDSYKNYSEVITLRYIRMKVIVVYPGGNANVGGRIYFMKILKN